MSNKKRAKNAELSPPNPYAYQNFVAVQILHIHYITKAQFVNTFLSYILIKHEKGATYTAPKKQLFNLYDTHISAECLKFCIEVAIASLYILNSAYL